MPQKLDDLVAQMRRLYEVERLTHQEIAGRFNVSKQAIHYRLKPLGVEFRDAGQTTPVIELEKLERLYIEKRLSAQQIADHLDCLIGKVYTSLKRHGIEHRSPRKHPELRDLKIGESIEVLRPKTTGNTQAITIEWAKLWEFGFQSER